MSLKARPRRVSMLAITVTVDVDVGPFAFRAEIDEIEQITRVDGEPVDVEAAAAGAWEVGAVEVLRAHVACERPDDALNLVVEAHELGYSRAADLSVKRDGLILRPLDRGERLLERHRDRLRTLAELVN